MKTGIFNREKYNIIIVNSNGGHFLGEKKICHFTGFYKVSAIFIVTSQNCYGFG